MPKNLPRLCTCGLYLHIPILRADGIELLDCQDFKLLELLFFYSKYIQLECNNFPSDHGTAKNTAYLNFNTLFFFLFFFLAQIENSISKKPTLQLTWPK